MSLRNLFIEMQEEFIATWGEYQKLHDELDLYRGKELNEEDSKQVNKVAIEIQERFQEMRPVIVFVMERYSFCNKASASYNKFIEDIKQAGAVEEKKSEA